jgi:ribonuclease-3
MTDIDEQTRVEGILAEAQERLGVRFADVALLREALTHTSYRNEHEDVTFDNQRLEFLGDSVLGCVIAHTLWERFQDEAEGMLTRYRALLVSEEGLATVARELGLGPLMLLGRGEELTGGAEKASLLADVYESVVAAIYLDQGFDRGKEIVVAHFESRIDRIARTSRTSDHKTKLQELIQRRFQAIPTYHIVGESGPDHDKTFYAELSVRGQTCSRGVGKTKKDAEQSAARAVWELLEGSEEAPLPRLEDQ